MILLLKKEFLFLYVLFFSFNAASEVYRVEKTENIVFAYASECSEIQNIRDSFIQLSEIQNSELHPTSPMCEKAAYSSMRMDLTDVLPLFILKTHNVHPNHQGPNCWNSTLVFSGILPYLRSSSPSEFDFMMSSPLCRRLSRNEEPQPGDTVAIRRKLVFLENFEEIHAFTFINWDVSFSKDGLTNKVPFSLKPTSAVFNAYGVKEACFRKHGEKDSWKECPIQGNFYRCESTESFLDRKPELQKLFTKNSEELVSLEKQTSQIAMDGGNEVSLEKLKKKLLKTQKTLQDSESIYQKEVIQRTLDEKLEIQFIFDYLKYRAAETLQQILFIEEEKKANLLQKL